MGRKSVAGDEVTFRQLLVEEYHFLSLSLELLLHVKNDLCVLVCRLLGSLAILVRWVK